MILEKDVSITDDGYLTVWSDSTATILGNVTIKGVCSRLDVGLNSSVFAIGDINVSERGTIAIRSFAETDYDGRVKVDPSKLETTANLSIGKDSILEIEDGSTLEAKGGSSTVTLEKGSVLKTYDESSIHAKEGATIIADKDVVLSSDLSSTQNGVAEKTFKLDGFSKLKISNLGEVTKEQAKSLRNLLLSTKGGILDVDINMGATFDENSNVSLDDALDLAGTAAYKNATVAGIDTSSKSLSDLAASDLSLSWGRAILAPGLDKLNVGTASLELNNAGKSGMFVQTADGKVGNANVDAGGRLDLNNSGIIGDVTGTGELNLGSGTKQNGSLITTGNLGTEATALESVFVGSTYKDVKVSVNSKDIYAGKITVLDGVLKANTVKTKNLQVGSGSDNLLSGDSATGVFVADTLELEAGGTLYGDPNFGMKASLESINNLSATHADAKYNGIDYAVSDGNIFSAKNNILALGTTSESEVRSIVSSLSLTDLNGSLSDSNVSSVLLLNKSLLVLDGTSRSVNPSINKLVISKTPLADMVTAGAADADVILGNNAGVVITGELTDKLAKTGVIYS